MKLIELCSGGGGQALGLEKAGFEHHGLIEIEKDAALTILNNRPHWPVYNEDLRNFDFSVFRNIDVVCGGIPCQPFSIAGSQLGKNDERDLFPVAILAVEKLKPKFFFFENVRGLATGVFENYRNHIIQSFIALGYFVEYKVIEASDYGVPQLRPRFILVGRRDKRINFPWPKAMKSKKTVSGTISDLLSEKGWLMLKDWERKADRIAPTIVGGSKRHGGPDLGPTRARRQWAEMGIDGIGIADEAPEKNFEGNPKLTNRMVARIQGFPDNWKFCGKKTSTYRQIGNAFPPPVAKAIGKAVFEWDSLKEEPRKYYSYTTVQESLFKYN